MGRKPYAKYPPPINVGWVTVYGFLVGIVLVMAIAAWLIG